MAWLAADVEGEWIFKHKPKRADCWWYANPWTATTSLELEAAQLAFGEIKRMIGRELTWDDEPVEI